MKNVEFDPSAFEVLAWRVRQDLRKALRIMKLIKEVQRTPFEGTGKPEGLKHELAGCWSRRIDGTHRLVYEVKRIQSGSLPDATITDSSPATAAGESRLRNFFQEEYP